MKHFEWKSVVAACVAATALYACDDDGGTVAGDGGDNDAVALDTGAGGAGGAGGEGGAGGLGGAGGEGGAGGQQDAGMGGEGGEGGVGGDPDAGTDALLPDMDVVDPDGALPDMGEVDAEPLPAIIPRGMDECSVDEPCAEPFHQCLDEACALDTRPTVYRMVAAEVLEPEVAAAELQLALGVAVQAQALNVLIEGGGYGDDDGYLMYIGSGRHDNGTYDYAHTFPIQNLPGHWRQPAEPTWYQDGAGEFILNVPSGFAMVDGEERRCFTRFGAQTEVMAIRPGLDEDGNSLLTGRVQGSLRRADIESVDFRMGDTVIRFIDFFRDEPPSLDIDGDGVPESYPFEFTITAIPIPFTDDPPDGTNRDPMPPDNNPPECAERD